MKNNDPAFPITAEQHPNGISADMGMSLRDYFAAKAMLGLCADPMFEESAKIIAERAYKVAAAMLAQRNK